MESKWTARAVVAASALVAALVAWILARPVDRVGDVPYVATRPPVVDRMLELAGIGQGDVVVDLGSGDGRIVLRAATRYGARARGIEIDPSLVRQSRAAAVAAGVAERVEFVEGDLFSAELGDATAVTMFLLPTVNLRLRPRLLAELAPGTPVVSHMWDMGAWAPDRHEVVPVDPPSDVYQWIVPAAFGGEWELTPEGVQGGTRLPDGATLRLLQRFQELEGELVVAGRSVAVAGAVRGEDFFVETTRLRPRVGSVAISGTIDADTLRAGWMLDGSGPGGEWSSGRLDPTRVPVVGRRRSARVEGIWEVGDADTPFVPRWSMQWARGADGWRVSRWTAAGGAADPGDSLPGSTPGVGSRSRGDPVEEVYVWGATIAFVVPAADGSARRVSYYGLVSGDRITGIAHDGSRRVRWTARRADAFR